MSWKNEIDRLIQAEQAKLVTADLRRQAGKARFQTLKTMMEEVVESLDSRYVQLSLSDDYCTLALGTRDKTGFMHAVAQWETRLSSQDTDNPTLRQFSVEEIWYGSDGDVHRDTFAIAGEHEVIQQLLKRIAPYLATQQWIDKTMNATR